MDQESELGSSGNHPRPIAQRWKLPRGEVVFFCQTFILYVVIVVSLYNLSRGHENGTLWTALLSGSLGIISPPPDLTAKLRVKHSEAPRLTRPPEV